MADTALSSWALLIWQTLQAEGLDADEIFKTANLDPKLLNESGGRYANEAMALLWQTVAQHTKNPCFGIEVGKRWSPISFHALGYAWFASHSLGDAMQRFSRYAKVVNTDLETRLEPAGIDYKFIVHAEADWIYDVPQVFDAAFVSLIKMCRLLLGESFVPLEVRLAVKASASRPMLEAALGARVIFNCERSEMIVARADIERELTGTSLELLRVNENLVQDYLKRLDIADIAQQVERALIEMLPSGGATEEQIASQLHMSSRSLQRKLNEDGSSFSYILQNTRQKMADYHLRENRLSLNEIAYLLGFSEQANFSRAFKRWYQCSPSEYRKELSKVRA